MTTAFEVDAARGKTAWWRYPAATVLALALSLGASLVLIVALMLARLLPADITTELLHATRPVVFFTATGLEFGIFLLGFVGALRLIHAKSVGDVAGRWSWRLVLFGAGLWMAVETIGALVEFALAPHAFKITASAATGPLALSAALGLAVQTFAEEFVFRGYATQALWLATRRLGGPTAADTFGSQGDGARARGLATTRIWVTAILSGLLFAAMHIPNGWPQAASALLFGVVTAVLAMRTGGIALTFGLHYVNNLFGAVVVVSSSDVFRGSPGLFTSSGKGLTAIDLATEAVALLALLWLASSRSPFGAQLMRRNASDS